MERLRWSFCVLPPLQRELELQCQRNEHKMKQLQRTVGELQAEGATQPGVQSERQGLERIRQQLLCAAGLLTSFINQTLDRCGTVTLNPGAWAL